MHFCCATTSASLRKHLSITIPKTIVFSTFSINICPTTYDDERFAYKSMELTAIFKENLDRTKKQIKEGEPFARAQGKRIATLFYTTGQLCKEDYGEIMAL